MKLKNAENSAIGQVMQNVMLLADIGQPKEPKMITSFLKKYFGDVTLADIEVAFDKWVIGSIESKKPMFLNAQFISSVIYAAIKGGHITLEVNKPQELKPLPLLSKEELHQGYLDMMEIWDKYEKTKAFDTFAKFFEIRYKYIYYNIDKMEFTEEQRYAMVQEIQQALIDKENRTRVKNTIADMMRVIEVRLPDVNWNRVACVCLHYRSIR